MKKYIRKEVTLVFGLLFVVILFLLVGVIAWIDEPALGWGLFAAALITDVCVFLPITLLSGDLNKIYFDEEGVKEYFFKKLKWNVLWKDITTIEIERMPRCPTKIVIEHKGSKYPLRIEYRKKSREAFLNNCPRVDLKNVIRQFIEDNTYRYTGKTKNKKTKK